MFGVHLLQFCYERFQSFVFQALLHPDSDVVRNGRNVVYALAYGIYVHHAAARKQSSIMLPEQVILQ